MRRFSVNINWVAVLFIAGTWAASLVASVEGITSEWQVGKNVKRIGDPRWGVFHTIYAPDSFVKNPPLELPGPPSSWNVEHFERWSPSHSVTNRTWDVARIGSKNREVALLITKEKWIRLNAPDALPIINNIMEGTYQSELHTPLSPTKMRPEVLAAYVDSVIELYRDLPGRVQMLSVSYWQSTFFSKNDAQRLRQYCDAPKIERLDDRTEVSCNFLNSVGRVERWTLTLTPRDSLTVTKVKEETNTEGDPFPYPTPDE